MHFLSREVTVVRLNNEVNKLILNCDVSERYLRVVIQLFSRFPDERLFWRFEIDTGSNPRCPYCGEFISLVVGKNIPR
jgi:hypothetical protein